MRGGCARDGCLAVIGEGVEVDAVRASNGSGAVECVATQAVEEVDEILVCLDSGVVDEEFFERCLWGCRCGGFVRRWRGCVVCRWCRCDFGASDGALSVCDEVVHADAVFFCFACGTFVGVVADAVEEVDEMLVCFDLGVSGE